MRTAASPAADRAPAIAPVDLSHLADRAVADGHPREGGRPLPTESAGSGFALAGELATSAQAPEVDVPAGPLAAVIGAGVRA